MSDTAQVTRAARPIQVLLAEKLLLTVVGIGLLRTGITVVRHLDVRTPWGIILTKLLLISLSLYLIWQLGRGRNWARWSLVGILAVAVPLNILPALDALSHSPVTTLLQLSQLALYLWALALLFRPPASHWFTAQRE